MATKSLLYKREVPVTNHIKIIIPTVQEVLEQEDNYYGIVYTITASPYDMMVQLDDAGIDFTQINDYELFLLMFATMRESDTSLVFGDLDLKKFVPVVNPQNQMVVLRDPESGAVIDRVIHDQICCVLRGIHHLKKNNKKPGNNAAKKYLLERARRKLKRRRNSVDASQLEQLIVSLVNTEQSPYDFASVQNLTIYQFNESVQQVVRKVNFDNRMHGIYAGTVSAKNMNPDDLNWLTHK